MIRIINIKKLLDDFELDNEEKLELAAKLVFEVSQDITSFPLDYIALQLYDAKCSVDGKDREEEE